MKRFHLSDLPDSETRVLAQLFGDRRITHGGIHIFQPGECAHPEPHVHDTDEVFLILQGSGNMPVDGIIHPITTGDVIVIEPGEDHHTTGSNNNPMVVAWYLMERRDAVGQA